MAEDHDMLLVRTPFRISLLGGASDDPSHFLAGGQGLVLGGAVELHSWISLRRLPPHHPFRHRFVYREQERVNSASELSHPAIRACLEEAEWDDADGLEVFHQADLPGGSGTGSSSSFVVGLLNALHAQRGRRLSPRSLASSAIRVERETLGEAGGWQDQVFAAHGGPALVEFGPRGYEFLPLGLPAPTLAALEQRLMLFHLGERLVGSSSDVSASYSPPPGSLCALARMAEEGAGCLRRGDFPRLGRLMADSWRVKCSLSPMVGTAESCDAVCRAMLLGAWGGKLMGAGGGGCLVLLAPPETQPRIESELGRARIPVRFARRGSEAIFQEG